MSIVSTSLSTDSRRLHGPEDDAGIGGGGSLGRGFNAGEDQTEVEARRCIALGQERLASIPGMLFCLNEDGADRFRFPEIIAPIVRSRPSKCSRSR